MLCCYTITACEGIQKPLFAEVQVAGLNSFSRLATDISSMISNSFKKRGYITSKIRYSAATSGDGKIYYHEPECATFEPHERYHILVQEAGIKESDFKGRAKTYYPIIDESSAMAVGEYSLLEKAENKEETAEAIKLERRFGKQAYNFVYRNLNLEQITEQQINEFAERSPICHDTKNWASILVDLNYFGLFDPCCTVLDKYGLEKGQEKLIELMKTLRDDETAQNFLRQLKAETGKRPRILKPIRDDIVMKVWWAYKRDDENFLKVFMHGPKMKGNREKCAFFVDMKKEVLAKHKKGLENLGELWMNIWANEVERA